MKRSSFFAVGRRSKTDPSFSSHSEPRSGEESCEQNAEAPEYGILRCAQDDTGWGDFFRAAQERRQQEGTKSE